MKRTTIFFSTFLLSALLSGSSSEQEKLPETQPIIQSEPEIMMNPKEKSLVSTETDYEMIEPTEAIIPSTILRPDWASYFGEINGAAVILDTTKHTFQVYNEDLADIRRSPCSTFKIISSLVGLENDIIDLENSTRTWSGESFWNDDWNQDIDFYSAFCTSCVWYYRQVIDDIGPDIMQEALEILQYGNCDISDWAGRLNTNNSNPALTGFWIESSLKISPKEQTQVLEQIFGSSSKYSPEIREALEEVMFFPEASHETCAIYGKTGMGKANGVVVDCWYTGFADIGHRIYFCIYLGETAGQNISSTLAKEIAVSLIKENY